MKKYFFMLLILIATTAVFSIDVDRPPDIDNQSIELTQNDFIFLVVIDQPVLTVEETIYQTTEQPTILVSMRMKGDTQKGKAITIHLKKSGTERYLSNYDDYNSKTVAYESTRYIESEELKPSIS